MRILVLASRRIESRQSGYDLRVANLCAHLPGEAHLAVIPLEEDRGSGPTGLAVDPLFASVEVLSAFPPGRERPRRYLRRSNDHYMQLSRPGRFAAARDRLREIVAERGITHVVVFGVALAELAATLQGVSVVLDVCDSGVLTTERALAASTQPSTGVQRWMDKLALRRKKATESRLPDRFDVVATISLPDTRAIERLRRGRRETIATVPNGVDEAFLTPLPRAGDRHGVVFWGNLGFAPNRDALWFFVHEVWAPHLRDEGVELCIVGPERPVLAGRDRRPGPPRRPHRLRGGPALGRGALPGDGQPDAHGQRPEEQGARGVRPRDRRRLHTPRCGGAARGPRRGAPAHRRGADAFADAVREVLKDPEHARALREDAHRLVDEHYRWDAVGRQWAGLFAATTSPA